VPLPEQRVQVSETRFRVPDICVMRKGDPRDQIVRTPPLICVEVLSPEDKLSRLRARVDDCVSLGVEHIWVIDPATRHAYTAGATGFIEVGSREFTVPGTPICVRLADLFGELDDESE